MLSEKLILNLQSLSFVLMAVYFLGVGIATLQARRAFILSHFILFWLFAAYLLWPTVPFVIELILAKPTAPVISTVITLVVLIILLIIMWKTGRHSLVIHGLSQERVRTLLKDMLGGRCIETKRSLEFPDRELHFMIGGWNGFVRLNDWNDRGLYLREPPPEMQETLQKISTQLREEPFTSGRLLTATLCFISAAIVMTPHLFFRRSL